MLKSFFFIPGNHPKLLQKLSTINADQLIIDLEDAFDQNEFTRFFDNLKKIDNPERLFFRPNLFIDDVFNNKLFQKLISLGITKFIIPKFKNLIQLQKIEKQIESVNKEFSFILLIENPNSLFSLQQILSSSKLNIVGLGFGSHDYCSSIGMKHSIDLLHYPRFVISGLAKAYNLTSIDIASMELEKSDILLDEIKSAYDYGFDAKFIIHPKQLQYLKNTNYIEIEKAKKIIKAYNKKGKPVVFKYEGVAIEPPHIKYYIKLIEKYIS